jgi:cellobiose transport system permease protein
VTSEIETAPIRRRSLLSQIWRAKHAYLFILPFYAFFIIFKGFPVLYSLYISFFKWRGVGEPSFVGLRNYQLLFLDPDFRAALWNTIFIWLGHMIPIIIIGLVLAAVLNSPRIKGRKVLRGIYFLPNVTSVVIVALVFAALLGTEYGMVNLVVTQLGGEKIPWLTSARWSKIAIIAMILWQWTGYFMVLMLAGLQAIPQELYEAAAVDGATPIQSFFHVTVPLMAPVLLFIIITSTFFSFQSFAEPFILTDGGPGNSSTTLGLQLYRMTFHYFRFGYGSAMAYAAGMIALMLAGLIWTLTKRYLD